jgi:hypothetical protein
MNLADEDQQMILKHLVCLRESVESLNAGIRNDLAEIDQSMDRIQAMGHKMVLMLASMNREIERANAKSN